MDLRRGSRQKFERDSYAADSYRSEEEEFSLDGVNFIHCSLLFITRLSPKDSGRYVTSYGEFDSTRIKRKLA